MQKYENKKRALLVKELIKVGAIARSIETGSTAVAFPDIYVCEGGAALIEVKKDNGEGPAWTRKLSFRPGQYSFLKRNYEHGGQSFTATFYANGVLFSHITSVDEITERPIERASHLFLNRVEGNGKLIVDWLKSFNRIRTNTESI